MTDLAHSYSTDVQFQETQVDAADTQFDIQKLGSNCNFLIDQVGNVNSGLSNVSSLKALLFPFSADGTYGAGSFPIYNLGTLLDMALVWVSPSTNPLFSGPAVPVIADRINNPHLRSTTYSGPGFNWRVEIDPNGVNTVLRLVLAGSPPPLLVRGVVFRG